MLQLVRAGVVVSWLDDEGWGVIDSDATPGGCWVNFSALVMDGYRTLTPGERVSFTYEHAQQDGYSFRACEVWPSGIAPGTKITTAAPASADSAYQSRLTITLDDGTVLFGDEAQRQIPPGQTDRLAD
jgi:cold shock protein